MTEENQLVLASDEQSSGALVAATAGYNSNHGFDLILRVAKMFAASTLVPAHFQNKAADCAIAVEIASRLGASPLMVMQNLYLIHGKPSWSSQFLIATINSCGLYSKLKFEFTGDGDDYGCRASAREKSTSDVLQGPRVNIKMAKAEGWYQKNGSKWPTMTDLMLTYRAAAFWARTNAPELTMGIKTREEIEDIEEPVTVVRDQPQGTTATLRAALGVSPPPPPEPVQAPPADEPPATSPPPPARQPRAKKAEAPTGQRPADAPPPMEPGFQPGKEPAGSPEPPPTDDDVPPAGPIEMD